jgi:4-hydroxy-4-methyl-2-oxoglutarate aldolase
MVDRKFAERGSHGAIDAQLVRQALRLSSATLHESSGRSGALPSTIKPIDPAMRVCGTAFPVRTPPGDNLWIHRAFAVVEPGEVLVVSAGDGIEFGYWGEIMAAAAATRGVAGLVINGGVRDTLALRKLGLPTFSACVSIRGTAKDVRGDGAIGERVRIGEVEIARGDLVFGDADGVVVLTPEQTRSAVPASIIRDAKEADLISRVRAGALTVDVYDL